jgi:hypothetical protein
MITLTAPEIDRFYEAIELGPDCWVWTREVNNKGYGRFTIWRGKIRSRLLAHRLSFQLEGLGEPAVVRHRCDNPPCVRPGHLEPGTQADNIADAQDRGRMNMAGLTLGLDVRWASRRALAGSAATKECNTCRATKLLEEFTKSAAALDGRFGSCRSCSSAYQRERRRIKRVAA